MSGRDVVFALAPNIKRDELTYALRSLDCIPHRDVYFLGARPPSWVKGVKHIPFNMPGGKWRNLDDKFRALRDFDFLSDEVYYTEDDYFVLEHVGDEIPNYYNVTMRVRVQREDDHGSIGGWSRSLRDTEAVLLQMGIENPLSFDMHIPMVVERHLIDPNVPDDRPLRWRSIIGNLSDRPPVHLPLDVKCREPEEVERVLEAGVPFLSSSDISFESSGIKAHLDQAHPTRCQYEQGDTMARKKQTVVTLRANTSFAVGQQVVREGQLVQSDDPLVKGRESLFTPADEMATANPGEVRMVAPPAAEEPTDGDDAE